MAGFAASSSDRGRVGRGGRDGGAVLTEAEQDQARTVEALQNITGTLAEIQEIGNLTTERLHDNTESIAEVNSELAHQSTSLQRNDEQLNTLEKWGGLGTWFRGGNKSGRKGSGSGGEGGDAGETMLFAVYENQRFQPGKSWKAPFLLHDPHRFMSPEGSAVRGDLADVLTIAAERGGVESIASGLGGAYAGRKWKVDRSDSNVDADGWCYAFDFPKLVNGEGKPRAGRLDFVRRRRWKLDTASTRGTSEAVQQMRARYGKAGEDNGSDPEARAYGSEAAGFGASPSASSRQARHASAGAPQGTQSWNAILSNKELSDEERARIENLRDGDKALDSSLDQISNLLDGITTTAQTMGEEVNRQNDMLKTTERRVEDNDTAMASQTSRIRRFMGGGR